MTDQWESMVTVGRVIRPHGIRGQMVVASETDFGDERFHPGALLWTLRDGKADTVRIATAGRHLGRWLVTIDGVTTIEAAEMLRGVDLKIPATEVRPLDAGAYYEFDLVGCRVETSSGAGVGIVRRVDFFSGPPLLAIEGPDGEVLVPLAEAICRRVDVEAKVIVIDPPDGLVELNVGRAARGVQGQANQPGEAPGTPPTQHD